uniref:Cysteine hydrolase n=1 Tax=Elaeophora elaphi TaxID=1147741 RepID=A0A0R3RNZ1_9BILA
MKHILIKMDSSSFMVPRWKLAKFNHLDYEKFIS